MIHYSTIFNSIIIIQIRMIEAKSGRVNQMKEPAHQQVSLASLSLSNNIYTEDHDNYIFSAINQNDSIDLSILEKDSSCIHKYELKVYKEMATNQLQKILMENMGQFYKTYFIDKYAPFVLNLDQKSVNFEYFYDLNNIPRKGNIVMRLKNLDESCSQMRMKLMDQFFSSKSREQNRKLNLKQKQLNYLKMFYWFSSINLQESNLQDFTLRNIEQQKSNGSIKSVLEVKKQRYSKQKEWSQICFCVCEQAKKVVNKNISFSFQVKPGNNEQLLYESKKKMYLRVQQIGRENTVKLFNDVSLIVNGELIREQIDKITNIKLSVARNSQRSYSISLVCQANKSSNSSYRGNNQNNSEQFKFDIGQFKVYLGIRKLNEVKATIN